MIKFIWINFDYVVCRKPLFLYFRPWCVSWDKQYAVAQDSTDFKELIVPCWEVGAPERECRHSDGEQQKKQTKHFPLAAPKAVTMATAGAASDESPALGTAQKRPSAANSLTRTYPSNFPGALNGCCVSADWSVGALLFTCKHTSLN